MLKIKNSKRTVDLLSTADLNLVSISSVQLQFHPTLSQLAIIAQVTGSETISRVQIAFTFAPTPSVKLLTSDSTGSWKNVKTFE